MTRPLKQPRIHTLTLPHPVVVRTEDLSPKTRFVSHSHPWGELNYTVQGVMELKVSGRGFLCPSHYAVWTPPGFEHDGYNSFETRYTSIYVEKQLCLQLPTEPCTLALGPLLRAILEHFDSQGFEYPKSLEDSRLVSVFIDQLRVAPQHSSYLPYSSHPKIRTLLQNIQADPGNNLPLYEWAQELRTTERTLARYFRSELGMSFLEWRQRLRLVTAMTRLNEGATVQEVALSLGYSTSSAFIAMFQKMTGTTPSQFRNKTGHSGGSFKTRSDLFV